MSKKRVRWDRVLGVAVLLTLLYGLVMGCREYIGNTEGMTQLIQQERDL